MQLKSNCEVRKYKDRSIREFVLDELKSFDCIVRPNESAICNAIGDWSHNGTKVWYKAPVERRQSMKTSDVNHSMWSRP